MAACWDFKHKLFAFDANINDFWFLSLLCWLLRSFCLADQIFVYARKKTLYLLQTNSLLFLKSLVLFLFYNKSPLTWPLLLFKLIKNKAFKLLHQLKHDELLGSFYIISNLLLGPYIKTECEGKALDPIILLYTASMILASLWEIKLILCLVDPSDF